MQLLYGSGREDSEAPPTPPQSQIEGASPSTLSQTSDPESQPPQVWEGARKENGVSRGQGNLIMDRRRHEKFSTAGDGER